MLTGEYTPTHRCSVTPTCSWAQTPNLPCNSPGSQPPQLLVPGRVNQGSYSPTLLAGAQTCTHTHKHLQSWHCLPRRPQQHTHTFTHLHGLLVLHCSQAGSGPGPTWGVTHWALSGHWPPDTQSSPAAGTMIHPWPWLVAPTHGPLKPYGGMTRQGAICTFPALFFPSHLYFLTVCSSPDHVNPPPSHLWLLP